MENTCPISHLFTFDCQTPARLKGEEAGGEATAKVEPFKVYLFDEEANSLIAFQTFREERGNLGGIETWASVLVHWERAMCEDERKGSRQTAFQHNKTLFSTYSLNNQEHFL